MDLSTCVGSTSTLQEDGVRQSREAAKGFEPAAGEGLEPVPPAQASPTSFEQLLESVQPIVRQLDQAVLSSGEQPEGNVLYIHNSFDPNPKNEPKQRNLVELAAALPQEDSRIIEIGFNAGHSSLLMLAAHPTVTLVCFDLCEHRYTRDCFEVLAAAYPGRLELVPGNSHQTLPKWIRQGHTADLIHVDGDHSPSGAWADLQHAHALARPGCFIVFDDVCFQPLRLVWERAVAEKLVTALPQLSRIPLVSTNKHAIGVFAMPATRASNQLVAEVTPVLQHRGRQRSVLVIGPVDHGQDSLLGYLTSRRPWSGKSPSSIKLNAYTTARHCSHWVSNPLRYHPATDSAPTLIQLITPPFHEPEEVRSGIPLADGVLIVVDCAEGLTEECTLNFGAAVEAGLTPVLLLNKLDKLLQLEPDNELCFLQLQQIVQALNAVLPQDDPRRLVPGSGRNVVFGRGSLSVAEAIGGWGFTIPGWIQACAASRGWDDTQVSKLQQRAWGAHYVHEERWSRRAGGERGFSSLVLRTVRRAYEILDQKDNIRGMERLAAVRCVCGVV